MNPGRSGVRLPNGTKENDDHYYKVMVAACRGMGAGELEETIERIERHYTEWSPVPLDDAMRREMRKNITAEWKAQFYYRRAARF